MENKVKMSKTTEVKDLNPELYTKKISRQCDNERKRNHQHRTQGKRNKQNNTLCPRIDSIEDTTKR